MTPDLDELERAAMAATPGPWCVCERSYSIFSSDRLIVDEEGREIASLIDNTDTGISDPLNAAFIAAANPATILALLSRLRTAEAALAGARGHVERLLMKAVRDEHGVRIAYALARNWQWPDNAPAAVHESVEEARAWLSRQASKKGQ